ncbi:thioredoxin family protein [Draconibacterium sp.]|nr:thioredoxin family protein [Draconibacterium sp.]
MRNLYSLIGFIAIASVCFSQTTKVYHPEADAKKNIEFAIKKASENGKHVFLQIGGNWCPWCIKFHNFVQADTEISAYVEANYEVVKVNYDMKNRQEELMSKLEFPQRFGFPVFVILDSKGNRIHTQNSAFLEKDKSYDGKRVLRFFQNWSASAIHPDSYKK